MFSGESNTPAFFRRLQQIWKTESITVAQLTGIPDSRLVAAYVCVNLACTSSIILQTLNTADPHPLIIMGVIFFGCSMSIPPHCAWGRGMKHGENTYPFILYSFVSSGPNSIWSRQIIWLIMHGDNTPTNKGCRRASREAHERDRITNEIV